MNTFDFNNKTYQIIGWDYTVGDLVVELNALGTKVMDVFIAQLIYPNECLIKKVELVNIH